MTDTTDYDIAIVGGGLVGLSLACALGQLESALRIALIETSDYSRFPPPGFDSRTVALSYSSQQIFQALQHWETIQAAGVAAIKTIHISDRGHPGVTRLQAHEQGVGALGYVAENRILGECLFAAVKQLKQVDLLAPASVTDIKIASDSAQLTLDCEGQTNTIHTKLVVAADGTESFVREHLFIKQQHRDYHQSALIANVATDKPHHNIAYERFTATGPMALLPLTGIEAHPHRYGLVWTLAKDRLNEVQQLSEQDFAAALYQRFGRRVGQFTRIGQRHCYPLGMTQIAEHVRHRLAFIGNAAHTLHPVAGQGFNLGLRDVAALVEVVRDAVAKQQDVGELAVLQRYAQWRVRDHRVTTVFTDSLVRIFSNNFMPMVVARNAGLVAMSLFAPLRKRLTHHAMGYIGRASLLARGLGL